MEIVTLELSGFKNYEKHHQFNLRDLHLNTDPRIFEEEREFFLHVILGIVFGFTAAEKEKYRGDPELNKTFTGVITLALEERTMMIERDFETDFVACLLSDIKTTRPIFQGKDFVDNGYSRPYLQMLRSIFPIVDKQLFLNVCTTPPVGGKASFHQIMHTLYILFTPQFKFSSGKFMVNEAQKIIHSYHKLDDEANQAEKLLKKKISLQHALKMHKTIENLQKDIEDLNGLIDTVKNHSSATAENHKYLQEKFPEIQQFNPLQLRADVLLWKSLRQIKIQHSDELRALKFRKNKIEQILNNELADYRNLPESFIRDAKHFQLLLSKIREKEMTDLRITRHINALEQKMDERNTSKKFLLLSAPPFLAFLTYILLGPLWMVIIPEAILAFLIVFAIFGHGNQKIRSQIFSEQEETHIFHKQIRKYEEERNALLHKYPFFEEVGRIEQHVDKYRKFLQFQHELKSIAKDEARIQKTLSSEPYRAQLPFYEEKYGTRIDIDRPDLQEYLDEYVELKMRSESSSNPIATSPSVEELDNLKTLYYKTLSELRAMRDRFAEYLHLQSSVSELQASLHTVEQELHTLALTDQMNFPIR